MQKYPRRLPSVVPPIVSRLQHNLTHMAHGLIIQPSKKKAVHFNQSVSEERIIEMDMLLSASNDPGDQFVVKTEDDHP